ncbi:MAG: 3-dehydroquinate synthase [Chitinophagaceae bacterium]
MNSLEYSFSGKKVQYFLDASFSHLEKVVSKDKLIIITDENVYQRHPELSAYKLIIIPAGEQHKNQSSVDFIIQQLIKSEADRKSFIVGVGGGVVTDITGFAASIYMRGVPFGFVPTTILAQVDASIGGKNGIDTGVYKNLVGVIRQPDFILFDYSFLKTLPHDQWVNGFAEVIKHGCIKDQGLFELLEVHQLTDFQDNHELLADLILRNVVIKSGVVERDEFENGERKLLNFGHTLGHAIENIYQLPHGHAISIGMAAACLISEELNEFQATDTKRVLNLLQVYGLPVSLKIDVKKVFEILKMDKKRNSAEMNFILLNRIGEAIIRSIPLVQLEDIIKKIN